METEIMYILKMFGGQEALDNNFLNFKRYKYEKI